MEFCIITPTSGLERYATLSKTHLVLAQVQDERYREFYLRRKAAGDTLILDNGAYEQTAPLSGADFAEACRFYTPQWIVCPDQLFEDWEHTYSLTSSFLEKYHDEFRGVSKFIGVPQTKPGDILGWIEGLFHMVQDLPLDGIGLPRALVTHYYGDPLTRVRMLELVNKIDPMLYCHAFGMVNGNVNELQALREADCDSCDSSAPVWRGWVAGLSLTDERDRLNWDEGGCPVDFNAKLPLSLEKDSGVMRGAKQKIQQNLEACGVNTQQLLSSNR